MVLSNGTLCETVMVRQLENMTAGQTQSKTPCASVTMYWCVIRGLDVKKKKKKKRIVTGDVFPVFRLGPIYRESPAKRDFH